MAAEYPTARNAKPAARNGGEAPCPACGKQAERPRAQEPPQAGRIPPLHAARPPATTRPAKTRHSLGLRVAPPERPAAFFVVKEASPDGTPATTWHSLGLRVVNYPKTTPTLGLRYVTREGLPFNPFAPAPDQAPPQPELSLLEESKRPLQLDAALWPDSVNPFYGYPGKYEDAPWRVPLPKRPLPFPISEGFITSPLDNPSYSFWNECDVWEAAYSYEFPFVVVQEVRRHTKTVRVRVPEEEVGAEVLQYFETAYNLYRSPNETDVSLFMQWLPHRGYPRDYFLTLARNEFMDKSHGARTCLDTGECPPGQKCVLRTSLLGYAASGSRWRGTVKARKVGQPWFEGGAGWKKVECEMLMELVLTVNVTIRVECACVKNPDVF